MSLESYFAKWERPNDDTEEGLVTAKKKKATFNS